MAKRGAHLDVEPPAEAVQIRLESLAAGGEAIGRWGGLVFFVTGGLPGELVTVQVVERRRTFARARLLSIDEASPHRVEPRCRHFGQCGGCTWQHMTYAEQVRAKTAIVREQLARIGHMPEAVVRECRGSPVEFGYRNSARLAFTPEGAPGYRAASSHEIAAVVECPILEPALQHRLQEVRATGAGGREAELRVQMDPINLGGVDYHVPQGAFFQVNRAVADLLVGEVLGALAPEPSDAVLDLYCGVGLFTVPIAMRVGRVVGVEVSEAAVRGARTNLRACANASLIESSVEDALRHVEIAGARWHAVVLDPPRRGVDRAALTRIGALRALRIVYVSCDPATFARDAALLIEMGYRLDYAQPLDMFPQTAHVETVGRFVRTD